LISAKKKLQMEIDDEEDKDNISEKYDLLVPKIKDVKRNYTKSPNKSPCKKKRQHQSDNE
jgi:hypothetical protein